MQRRGIVTLAILVLVAFCSGFLAVSVVLNLTQPALAQSDASVGFPVRPGDGVSTVATRLHNEGLIRNALVFQLLARSRRLDAHLQPGIYRLSANMTMSDILARLAAGHPDAALVIAPPGDVAEVLPPGLRLTQYPAYFTHLPTFNAASFLKITQSGILPSGKALSDLYWYVPPKASKAYYALEGYLLPGVYFIAQGADESTVVQQMLDRLGEQLCPGPDAAHLDQYIHDQAQCKAHAVGVGPKKTNIFTDMEQHYFTTDDTQALYSALTLASLVVRTSTNDADAVGIAGVYDNRLITWKQKTTSPAGEPVQYMDAPATVQYARDSDHPPQDDNWWSPLTDQPQNVETANPYNTTVLDTIGLPPGPIAAPAWGDVVAAATANEPTSSPYYFVITDRCGRAHFAKDQADFLFMQEQANAGCFDG
jgi:UPF0755 protein